VQLATRVLGVSESGYYEWRGRAPSVRAVRHAWLTGRSRPFAWLPGIYGSRRVRCGLPISPSTRPREGKVYCAVVLDPCSRRVVGWSIDSSQTAWSPVHYVAIRSRTAGPDVVIHSDRGSVAAAV